jgi:hypothetical protein
VIQEKVVKSGYVCFFLVLYVFITNPDYLSLHLDKLNSLSCGHASPSGQLGAKPWSKRKWLKVVILSFFLVLYVFITKPDYSSLHLDKLNSLSCRHASPNG